MKTKAQVTINGKTVDMELELTQEQMGQFVEYGRATKGERYYYVDGNGNIATSLEDYSICDDARFNTGNYILEEKQAEKQSKRERLNRLLQRFSDEHGGDSEWDGRNMHWRVVWDYSLLKLMPFYSHSFRSAGEVYFNSERVVFLAIEKYRDELMEVLG